MKKTKKRGKENPNKKNNNKDNFIYNNLKQSIKDLKLIKSFLIFSSVLFLVITLIGAIFPVFFEEQIFKILEQIIKQTENLTPWELTGFIMSNNIKTSFFALILGIFLGIIPLAITIVNAYVLGFVMNKAVSAEGILILWKLFPHGIFEIPAILISISLGLRLGLFIFIYRGKNKLKEYFKWITQSLRIFIFIIIPLLVVAGIIEGLLIWLVN
jgi:stage II sporulation protein M